MTTPLSDLPRLQHVTLTFPRGAEHRLREFYSGVLGFPEKPVPRVAKPLGWIWFQTAEAGTELHFVPDERPVPPDSAHHLCLQVTDLENYGTKLAKAGFLVLEARPLPFRPRFFTRDPFNNLIEVVCVERDYIEAGEGAG